jgi:hypothetical protein
VLGRYIEGSVSDVTRAKSALVDACGALHALRLACVPSWPPSPELTRLSRILRIDAQYGVVFDLDYSGNRASERWARYADELKTNADAPPPT